MEDINFGYLTKYARVKQNLHTILDVIFLSNCAQNKHLNDKDVIQKIYSMN